MLDNHTDYAELENAHAPYLACAILGSLIHPQIAEGNVLRMLDEGLLCAVIPLLKGCVSFRYSVTKQKQIESNHPALFSTIVANERHLAAFSPPPPPLANLVLVFMRLSPRAHLGSNHPSKHENLTKSLVFPTPWTPGLVQ